MSTVAAWVAVLVLVLLAAFQVALACGAPLGRFAWGGQHTVLPSRLRVGSLAALPVYAVIAVVLLGRAGVHDAGDGGVVRVGAWVVVAYLVVGTVMNAASRSRAERLTMTPVTFVLAAASLVVATG